jgi:hypothetical protein
MSSRTRKLTLLTIGTLEGVTAEGDKVHRTIKLSVEFKWQDLWVGLFYNKFPMANGAIVSRDWYLCIIPMVPLHLEVYVVNEALLYPHNEGMVP